MAAEAKAQRRLGARVRPPALDAELSSRRRDAFAIGGVSDLEALGHQLLGGSAADAGLGQQINQLAANFDFDGLRELAGERATRHER